jgi:hypothetical protein
MADPKSDLSGCFSDRNARQQIQTAAPIPTNVRSTVGSDSPPKTRRGRRNYGVEIPTNYCYGVRLGGFSKNRFPAVDQNLAKVASSPVTDAGGNLWTCYHQARQTVTINLVNCSEITDITGCRSI